MRDTDDGERATETRTDESDENRIDRRTVLKGTAAAGVAGAGFAGTASADDESEIRFCAAGSETFSYFVRVSGSLRRGGPYESDEYDAVGDDFAEGSTSEERCDSFLFTGEVEELKLDGPGKVLVDGELYEDTTGGEDLSNSIVIEGQGEKVEYKFRVSGRVEKGDLSNDHDEIDGNVVRGRVDGSGKDDYSYSGSLAFDRADGPLTVTLDLAGD